MCLLWNISITNDFELKVLTAGHVLKIQSSGSSPVYHVTTDLSTTQEKGSDNRRVSYFHVSL